MQEKAKPMASANWTFDHEDFDLACDMVGGGSEHGSSKVSQQARIALRRLITFFAPSRKKPDAVVTNSAFKSPVSSRSDSDR